MRNQGFLAETKKERYRKAPLPRKTSYATRVALQHCPALHMSKRKFMVPITGIICQYTYWLYLSVTVALFRRQGGLISPLGWL